MQIRGTSNIQTAQQVRMPNQTKPTENNQPIEQQNSVDQLDISLEARSLNEVGQANDIRTEKVAEIRTQIESGQYETTEKLDVAVDRLLDEMA